MDKQILTVLMTVPINSRYLSSGEITSISNTRTIDLMEISFFMNQELIYAYTLYQESLLWTLGYTIGFINLWLYFTHFMMKA